MLNVVREQKGNVLVVRLTGAIGEDVDFDKLIGPAPPELHVNCRGVTRINSVGVRAWIRYFQKAKERGSKIRFLEASTAIVEQLNLISNFSVGAPVDSVFVPFSCENCSSELVGLFGTAALKKVNAKLPVLKCSKCGGKAVFDDIPEEYFIFLKHVDG